MKNNYIVLIYKAKINTNITLQPKSLIIAFCKRQEAFIDKLLRINDAHILICSTYPFRRPKYMPKDDPVVETLQGVMYSRGSTTSSNIVILRNYLQSKNNNANKSLKNSLSDLKKPSTVNNTTEFEDGGFKTFAILSIDNLLAHYYNIMQTQTVNNPFNQNKSNEKMHCNSTFIVGKIWLRDFISNSQYIKPHFNKTFYKPDFINETMFDTPLLDRYVEVVNKVYNILTTQISFKNILKPLGQNFIYVIFSNR
ncbi:hypothetical protein O3G_MSEX008246 [Manduca sexta]|uniref:Uncharacterized protein n=2 Tax=Manduca sexta TaxID=7130 RepID=A0A922CPP8_MANSE|nr:hypothetical protein O3G_MSEX008246 [Manduca sexta]